MEKKEEYKLNKYKGHVLLKRYNVMLSVYNGYPPPV